jgi:rhodanese-related sulfurtransferase/cytochrome c553
MNFRLYTVAFLLLGASCALAADSDAQPEKPQGQVLFEKHGCTNCHGANGVHPEARYVPVLRGKPAADLYRKALAIFGGEEASDKTVFMHDQFCIGQAKEEGCYTPPDEDELRLIAAWLGTEEVPEKKRTTQGLYVTALEAYQQLQALGDKALFIDVRTRPEVAFLGMPTIADANIPYMTAGRFDEWDDKKQNFKLTPNSEFTMRVNELVEARGMDKDTPIYLICRSGSRSAKAANILGVAGYTKVYTITDGFEGDTAKEGPRKGERVVNGWKNDGLPWTYELDRNAMYWDL